jgi:hypothetical protein
MKDLVDWLLKTVNKEGYKRNATERKLIVLGFCGLGFLFSWFSLVSFL